MSITALYYIGLLHYYCNTVELLLYSMTISATC